MSFLIHMRSPSSRKDFICYYFGLQWHRANVSVAWQKAPKNYQYVFFPAFKLLLNTQKYLKGQLPILLLSGDYSNMMCLSPIVSSENPPVSSVFCLDWDGMQLMAVTFMVA